MKKTKALAAVLAAVIALAGCSADKGAPKSTSTLSSSSSESSAESASAPENDIQPSIKPHGDKTLYSSSTESTSSDESTSGTESVPGESSELTPEWTEEPMEATMYVIKDGVYSIAKPVDDAETVKPYEKDTQISVVAKTDTGYYKLDDGSFIHMDNAEAR